MRFIPTAIRLRSRQQVAGKTIMLSAVLGRMFDRDIERACVLAHRDELTFQNEGKFKRVNPSLSTSIFNANEKSWDGQVAFAMVQTLSRESNLQSLPPLDTLVIDEAHHTRAGSYMRVIEHAQNINPNLKLLGMTATPNRVDKKGLRPIFSNVSDQITVKELIASGHLVPPRTFVMNVGVQEELSKVRKTALDYDMGAVADIMNTRRRSMMRWFNTGKKKPKRRGALKVRQGNQRTIVKRSYSARPLSMRGMSWPALSVQASPQA